MQKVFFGIPIKLPASLLEEVEKHDSDYAHGDSEQKAGNKEFSSKGVFVEQVIRIVKIFRVPQQRFPLNSPIYSQVILTNYLWFSHIRNWFISFAHFINVMDMRSVMNLSSTSSWIVPIINYSQPLFFPGLFPHLNTMES